MARLIDLSQIQGGKDLLERLSAIEEGGSTAVSIQGKDVPVPTATDDKKALVYDGVADTFKMGNPDANAVTIQGKLIPVPTASEDEKSIAYDHDIGSFKYINSPMPKMTISSAITPNNMTSNNTPLPYVASGSAGSDSFNAFDGNPDTYVILLDTGSQYVQIDLGSALKAQGYSIKTANGINDGPSSFRIDASTDGTTFVTVDMRTSQTWAANEKKIYSLSTPTPAYRYWRLYVLSGAYGGGWINEWVITGESSVNHIPKILADGTLQDTGFTVDQLSNAISGSTGGTEKYDNITPTSLGQTSFVLTQTPNSSLIKMYINRVPYFENIDFTVNRTTKTITWTYTATSGGFDIDTDDSLIVVYKY